jgi:hypothetical protein
LCISCGSRVSCKSRITCRSRVTCESLRFIWCNVCRDYTDSILANLINKDARLDQAETILYEFVDVAQCDMIEQTTWDGEHLPMCTLTIL